ncbi:MAG TPA: hypothetical protein VIA18_03890 [Polyangia bacterium]|jgi:hypothetical protein|nr:hypothetical protein [Polyangia bacterium]HWE30456.1 hypothetical protein [Polyangia bacterium]
MQLRFTLTAAAILCALASPARAEIIQLLDNTQMNGKIVHYYEGTFAIETSDGQKVELPTSKIKSITFKLPPARAEYSTPEKTFGHYRDALVKNDIPKLIECYALMYQGVMANEMSHASDDQKKKMQSEIAGTKLEIKSSKITGATATLKVQRTKGDEVETADVRMVLENGEWKLTP